jgi:pilus assembly protein CpaE
MLRSYLNRYPRSSLDVLCGIPQTYMASEPCLGAEEQGESFVMRLLEVAEPMYDFIIFDLGQAYYLPVHLAVLMRASLIFLVVNSTITSLYAANRSMGALREAGLLEGDRLRVVVNKYHPDHGIGRNQVREALGLPAFAEIPMDDGASVVQALNEGEPLVIHDKKCQVSRRVMELASSLYPPLVDIAGLRNGKKSGGLLSKLVG